MKLRNESQTLHRLVSGPGITSYCAMCSKSVVADNVANELRVPEMKSINWLSLKNFTPLVLIFYPIGSVCLFFFSCGQHQPDKHEISVYTE